MVKYVVSNLILFYTLFLNDQRKSLEEIELTPRGRGQ